MIDTRFRQRAIYTVTERRFENFFCFESGRNFLMELFLNEKMNVLFCFCFHNESVDIFRSW